MVFVPISPGCQIARNQSNRLLTYSKIKKEMHRPKISLSWGMNQPNIHNHNKDEGNVIPSTINVQKTTVQQDKNINNIKVLTESSESEQDELTKLIKHQNSKRIQQQAIQIFNKRKQKQESTNPRGKSMPNKKIQQQNSSNSQFIKRLKYLENSLLPTCKRDNMATIFDYNLNKQVPLNQSRLSGKSSSNKKNQSSVVFGNGFNVFTAAPQPEKQHLQRLREMYEYQENYKKRIQQGHFQLG